MDMLDLITYVPFLPPRTISEPSRKASDYLKCQKWLSVECCVLETQQIAELEKLITLDGKMLDIMSMMTILVKQCPLLRC